MQKDFDYLKQMVNYIRKNLKKGYTKESLFWALTNQGHSKNEIERAFKKVEEEMVKEAPILKTKPNIKYEVVDHKEIEYNEPSKPAKKSFWGSLFG